MDKHDFASNSSNNYATAHSENLDDALKQWESEQNQPPSFEAVLGYIASSPSPMKTSRWSLQKSLKLVTVLALAQFKVVPWLILPVVLISATMAILAAQFFGATLGRSASDAGFAMALLIGIVITLTMALSNFSADSIALTTPIGSQTVLLARIALVLGLDTAIGIIASGLVSAWGYTSSMSEVIVGWLLPLALIAAATALASTWVSAWTGIVTGITLIPLTSPASDSLLSLGISGLLWKVLSPLGVLALGIALLWVAVVSARKAALNQLQFA